MANRPVSWGQLLLTFYQYVIKIILCTLNLFSSLLK